MNARLMYNTAIINKLAELVKLNPQLRFHQLLWAAGLTEKNDDEIIDKFYEESEQTWKKMTSNPICFPQEEDK